MFNRIQGKKDVTRVYPDGKPDSHPAPLMKDAIPISNLVPFLKSVNGLPESLLQIPTLLYPDVQTCDVKKNMNKKL